MKLLRQYLNQIRTRHFYKELIHSADIHKVFDIGANTGNKSKTFLKHNCAVIALEPNPACSDTLNKLRRKYPDFKIVQKGLLPFSGKAKLNLGNISEVATFSDKFIQQFTVDKEVYWNKVIEVEVISISDLINEFGIPDFIKLDCEGLDYGVIKSLTIPVRMIEFEYTKPFADETIASILHIASLGNYVFNFSPYENSRFLYKEWLKSNAFIDKLAVSFQTIIHGNVYCWLKK